MRIGFIGTGNMGCALAKAVVKTGAQVMAYDTDREKAQSACEAIGMTYADVAEIAKKCDYVFLAVKPNIIPTIIYQIRDQLNDGAVVISMAAGVSTDSIKKLLGNRPLIRIMPNTPVAVGEGLILYCTSGTTDEAVEGFKASLMYAGAVEPIDECKIDAAAAISGCGPAFVYMFIEALADGGVASGLPRDAAQAYAARTVLGAAKNLIESGKHPGELKDAVCSPGGTTIAGVCALESGAFRSTAANAVIAAYEKTLKLTK